FSRGLDLFYEALGQAFHDAHRRAGRSNESILYVSDGRGSYMGSTHHTPNPLPEIHLELDQLTQTTADQMSLGVITIPGVVAFQLSDTFGFPFDMTQLLARERGIEVDEQGFRLELEMQRQRSRAAQEREVIVAATE